MTILQKNLSRYGAVALSVAAGAFIARSLLKNDKLPLRARGSRVVLNTTIARRPEELFSLWKNFELWPFFIESLQEVRHEDDGVTYWRAAIGERMVSWRSELTEEKEECCLAWTTLPGSDIEHHGRIEFNEAPGAHGTEVHVELFYSAPFGKIGKTLTRIAGRSIESVLSEELRHFKQFAESGETPRATLEELQ